MKPLRKATLKHPLNLGVSDIGAWVRLPDGAVGQVWALGGAEVRRGKRGTRVTSPDDTVWVALGDRYVEQPISALSLAAPDSGSEQESFDLDVS